MDDYNDAALEILASAQAGTFWELRAARLKGTAEGEIAAHQADTYAQMLTVEMVMADDPAEHARTCDA